MRQEGFWDFLLQDLHPEKAGSDLCIQSYNNTSITNTIICSTRFFPDINGKHVVQLQLFPSDLFSDEFLIFVSQFASTQNNHICGAEKSRETQENELQSKKVQSGALCMKML